MDRVNDLHLTQPDAQADTRRRGKGYAWSALAALTRPCHVPIYAVLLSGTALGAVLGDNLAVAFAAVAGVFLIALVIAKRHKSTPVHLAARVWCLGVARCAPADRYLVPPDS